MKRPCTGCGKIFRTTRGLYACCECAAFWCRKCAHAHNHPDTIRKFMPLAEALPKLRDLGYQVDEPQWGEGS